MNSPQATARVYVLVCMADDPESRFERHVFDHDDLDTIPEGWEAEVTFKLRKKPGLTPVDVFAGMEVVDFIPT